MVPEKQNLKLHYFLALTGTQLMGFNNLDLSKHWQVVVDTNIIIPESKCDVQNIY